MEADILVLDHDPPGLQRIADIEVLFEVEGRGRQPPAQLIFAAVVGEGDAIHRANVDAGIAFDTQLTGKYGLHVAVQAALGLKIAELFVVTEFDLDPDVGERDRLVPERHPITHIIRNVVVIAPLVDAHLLADQSHAWRRPVADILAVAQFVDRNRGIVAVRDRPDDVFGTKGGVAAKEHLGQRRLHRLWIDFGHVPAVEFNADVALDPRKRVLLADRDQHVVARDVDVGLAGRDQVAVAAGVVFRLDLFKQNPGQVAAVVGELFRYQPVEDRDAFMRRVLFFPGRSLHFVKAAAHDNGDLLSAEPARRAAAIHRRIAAAEDDDAAPDLVDMTERDAGQPVDADMDVVHRLVAAGDLEI